MFDQYTVLRNVLMLYETVTNPPKKHAVVGETVHTTNEQLAKKQREAIQTRTAEEIEFTDRESETQRLRRLFHSRRQNHRCIKGVDGETQDKAQIETLKLQPITH